MKTAADVDYSATVASVKASLQARGVDLSGPAGGYAIVSRVAWLKRADGAGLLRKTSGNRYKDCSVDIIAFPDGSIADCLGDAGGENKPTWQVGTPVDASRWVAPTDPGDDVETPTEPTAGTVDLAPVLAALNALAARVAALEARPVPTIACEEQSISTSRSWAHSHTVNVPVTRVQGQ